MDYSAVMAFHPQLGNALLLQLVLGLIGQSAHMGGGVAHRNDKIIGDGGQILHLQHPDVHRLFGVQCPCQFHGKFFAVHSCPFFLLLYAAGWLSASCCSVVTSYSTAWEPSRFSFCWACWSCSIRPPICWMLASVAV